MAIQIRRPNKSLWRTLKEDMNLVIILLAIGLFGLLFSLIYIPGWQIFFYSIGFKFQLMFLHIWDLILCFGFAFFGCILPFEIVRWISRKLGIIF